MARPSTLLANSLERLKELQTQGRVAVRSVDLSRTNRERLVRAGFLREVMKGWYIPTRPDETPGETTPWYAAYWRFVAQYLEIRFGRDWCLSADQSLLLHVGDRRVPPQLLVRSPRGSNKPTTLLHDASVFDLRLELPGPDGLDTLDDLRVMTLEAALVHCSPGMYTDRPTEMRAALGMLRGTSDLLRPLLEGGRSKVTGRLAGALRNVGRGALADELVGALRSAGYSVQETDPFLAPSPVAFGVRSLSPYVGRLRLGWAQMREPVLEHFSAPPAERPDREAYLKRIDDVYRADAYHSLSIEGYRVSDELIERVRSGNWNPEANEADRQNRSALAARGYWQAFQQVKAAVAQVLDGASAGDLAGRVHPTWYQELFGPSVAAGILQPADLAGYRNGPVYIRGSLHVPPSREGVRELMPELFTLLAAEPEPAVRVVLGHFYFVYIHPYTDGNGRMGRFLMNLMVASGGWSWTLITLETRDAYMAALESASVEQDIVPLTRYLAERLTESPAL
ncbi:MAG: Fic family protein [Steroidobacteraceae bacterium]|nr:Fic family protein [Steroidobacteraceae bacterium]